MPKGNTTAAGSFPGPQRAGTPRPGISLSKRAAKGAPPPFGAPLTADEMGALLGIAPRTVRELAGRGVVLRAGRGRYDAAGSVASYCAHLREQAAGRAGDAQAGLTSERARQAREQADHLALKNAEMRRELLPAAEVERAWTEVLRDIRARMLAVPARCMARLGRLSPSEGAILDEEVRDALQGAADAS
ncbi:hypothetical protein GCM10017643_14040 [Ancylobacter dichloromethanicus]|uniref:Phage DNA packaging protein Nu1 n=2 Tax=Ancylobacter dichloromethanicus TaxID=518825 RepID=A0A9W6MY55_9HYPH|nr:hypothetical protein GCM10017643_14040 [Ancylobacter dichloromethanicus]